MTFRIKKSGTYEARRDMGAWAIWKEVNQGLLIIVAEKRYMNPTYVEVLFD